jgi:hypothetical protein
MTSSGDTYVRFRPLRPISPLSGSHSLGHTRSTFAFDHRGHSAPE